MKKFIIKAISVILGLTLCCSVFAGCGGSSKNSITFLYSGSTEILEAFGKMVDKFNETVGKENGIQVKKSPNPESGVAGVLTQRLPAKSGPDVVAISDEVFKINSKNLMDLTNEFDQTFLDAFYENIDEKKVLAYL